MTASATQPIRMMIVSGASRRSLRAACRAFLSASAVTVQALRMQTSDPPEPAGSSAWSARRIASLSYWLARQP